MSKFEVGTIATGAGSTTLPFGSFYAATTVMPRVQEIGVFNTTATSCAIKIVRLSTAGTKGTAITMPLGLNGADPSTTASTAFQAHSVAPTFTDIGRRGVLGAAIGSGVIWTWNDYEFVLAASATAGFGLIGDGATPQLCSWYVKWYE